MAHNTRIRVEGGWTDTTTVRPVEFEAFDERQFQAINGDEGGAWAPSSPIVITGDEGLEVYRFFAGNMGLGNYALAVDADLVLVAGNVEFQGGFVFAGPDPATFTNASIGALGVTGTAIFGGTVQLNGATTVTGSLTLDGNDMTLTGATAPLRAPGPQAGQCRIGSMAPNGAAGFTMTRNPQGSIATFNTTSPSAAQSIMFEVLLNYNIAYSQFDVLLKGDSSHVSIAGMTMPTVALFRVDLNGNATLVDNTAANPGSNAGYISGSTVSLTFSSFIPGKNERYVVSVTNEGGSNAVGGMSIAAVKWYGTPQTFGNTGEI